MSIMGRGSSDSEAPPFGSVALPSCVVTLLAPGCIADDAARIECPVFVGAGERDTLPVPHHEPAAYEKSSDVTVFVAPGWRTCTTSRRLGRCCGTGSLGGRPLCDMKR